MKTYIILAAICITFVCTVKSVSSQSVTPTENYSNHYVLIEPDIYHVFWNNNDTDIKFEVHVKQTYGWFGFGLSLNGGMHNAVCTY